jgi:hypothetical protein
MMESHSLRVIGSHIIIVHVLFLLQVRSVMAHACMKVFVEHMYMATAFSLEFASISFSENVTIARPLTSRANFLNCLAFVLASGQVRHTSFMHNKL